MLPHSHDSNWISSIKLLKLALFKALAVKRTNQDFEAPTKYTTFIQSNWFWISWNWWDSRDYSVLVGCQDWYLVQSFCPGLRVCPLEWYMYSSPSPERFSLCSTLYLFGFNIRSCNKSQLFLSKWIFTLYFTNYVREGYLIPSMISYEVKPTMPFGWYLRSIVATLLSVFNPPVPSYKMPHQVKSKALKA